MVKGRTFSVMLFACIIFIILTIVTSSLKSPSDGNDLFGFPLTFYTYLGGKKIIEPESRIIMNYYNLLVDIGFVIVLSLGMDYIRKRIQRARKEKTM